jgi:hypothetical protein
MSMTAAAIGGTDPSSTVPSRAIRTTPLSSNPSRVAPAVYTSSSRPGTLMLALPCLDMEIAPLATTARTVAAS